MTFLLSHKDMDTSFVAKVITERSLDSSPKIGFVADPVYWQETERWRRSVEKYKWGAVIFMLDRQGNRGATAVAIGNVDVDLGRVSIQGGHQQIGVSWYHDMVTALRTAASPATLAIPPCLGFREADAICDGGLNREHRKMEPACAWRDRCMALQEYAVREGKPQERILAGKSPSQIVQLTTRLLERRQVNGTPHPTPAALVEPSPAPRQPLAPRATSKPSDGARSNLVEKFQAALNEVAEAAGVRAAPDWAKGQALPGDLYLEDRLERSGYISVYQALSNNKKRAVALFRIRPRDGIYNVQLPIAVDSEWIKGIRKEEVRAHRDGAFHSMVMNVEPDSTRLAHIRYAMHMILTGE